MFVQSSITDIPKRPNIEIAVIASEKGYNRNVVESGLNSLYVLTEFEKPNYYFVDQWVTEIHYLKNSGIIFNQFGIIGLSSWILKESIQLDKKFIKSINYTFKRLGSKTPKRI